MNANITQEQLVTLWSQLEQAYYGDNKFGGNVAEIYVYTVMEYSPSVSVWIHRDDAPYLQGIAQETYKKANAAFYQTLWYFARTRTCKIEVDDVLYWFDSIDLYDIPRSVGAEFPIQTHRWQVRVIR